LKRELSLLETTLYGVGIILGAGIYALIGVGAGIAGNALWISFILAAGIAAFTGLSYAELVSMFPKEAAEYVYTQAAFNKRALSFIVELVMVIAGIVSIATVALGFGGYFSYLFGFPALYAAIGLILVLSYLNYCGIKESAWYNAIATLIETGGLLIIIGIGFYIFSTSGISADLLTMPGGEFSIYGIISATAIIFFAYIGFENIANISEEVKNARKVIPKAMILSIIISTIIYILVAISAIEIVGWENLAASSAPLTEVVKMAFGANAALFMSLIALFATSNTVLVLLIVTSRILYGMSCQGSIPTICSRVSSHGTPYFSIIIIGFSSLAALAAGGLKTIALLSDIGIFIVYFFVNLSLIILRWKLPEAQRPFKSPGIGKIPLIAVLGLISSGAMLLFFETTIVIYEIIAIVIGFGFYFIFRKR